MLKYLDNLELGAVAKLSGAKPDTIKKWIQRGQLDAPDIYGDRRIFMSEHVLQVCLMKLLCESGIPAREAGVEARRKAVEAIRQLESGDVLEEPLASVLKPHLDAWLAYEADRNAEDVARLQEHTRRMEQEIAAREEWRRTWGDAGWVAEQRRKAEADGDKRYSPGRVGAEARARTADRVDGIQAAEWLRPLRGNEIVGDSGAMEKSDKLKCLQLALKAPGSAALAASAAGPKSCLCGTASIPWRRRSSSPSA